MAHTTNRADRFVRRLYTRGKTPLPDTQAERKEAMSVAERLARKRAGILKRLRRV